MNKRHTSYSDSENLDEATDWIAMLLRSARKLGVYDKLINRMDYKDIDKTRTDFSEFLLDFDIKE